ncbi:MAG: hypothetical protein DDT19_01771 [Syntrophomonadaceae bacterium]|nr:hypothetical protein [Bacillota bacterium]
MVRRFDTTHKREEYDVSLYSSKERDAKRIGDVHLIYENDKLVTLLFFPAWSEETGLKITRRDEYEAVRRIGEVLEEMFSVTGLRGFER